MKKISKEHKEIEIIYKINKNEEKTRIRLFGEKFYEENKEKCKIILNKKETNLYEFYNYKKNEKDIGIKLIIKKKLTDLNSMFSGCLSLFSIANLTNLDTSEVNDMSFMFYECSSLHSLSGISEWNTSKVNNMSFMFYGCSSLKSLNGLSKWDTSKVTDMSFMFYECSSLSTIKDISKWDGSNLVDMNSMFYKCSELESLPDISKWNISDQVNKDNTFYDCSTNKINIFELINKNNKNEILDEKENDDIITQNNEFDNNENFRVLMNDNLKFLPQVEIKFEGNFKIENNMINTFKDEVKKLFEQDNFSFIEINKGSFKVLITLQFISKKVLESIKEDPALNNIIKFPEEINKEVFEITKKLKDNKFLSMGSIKPDFVQESILDIKDPNNQKKLEKYFISLNRNKNDKKVNLYEHSKNITIKDLEELIEKLSNDAEKQEINQKLKNFEEFYDNEKEIEEAISNSIFEYKIININLVIRDNTQYKYNKERCPNKEIKLLFHGTTPDKIVKILSDNFNCISEIHIIGQGSYFTDNLDYVWFYSGNSYRNRCYYIPKVNDSFLFIGSEIYYDKTKREMVYDTSKKDLTVQSNGIRCNKVNGETRILSKNEIKNNKGFIANEFLISDKNQIFPIFGITMKRCKYLIIWRDYNFDRNNPNEYNDEDFQKMIEFNEEIKKFSSREVDSKVYYVKNSEEGLKLIKRKKYNKIILISNGNNNARQYIFDAREIIGSDCIALISSFQPYNHLDWVKDFQNTLISNKMEFHKKFIKSAILFDLKGLIELKNEIEDYYGKDYPFFKFKEFNSEVLKYPNFKEDGKFSDLQFE